MCVWSRRYNNCGHTFWIERVELCDKGIRFIAGQRPWDCTKQTARVLRTVKVGERCSHCIWLDQQLRKIRELVRNSRELLERRDRREERERKEEEAEAKAKEKEDDANKGDEAHFAEDTLHEANVLSSIREESYDGDEDGETEMTCGKLSLVCDDDCDDADLDETF